jgi:hypothetical protein
VEKSTGTASGANVNDALAAVCSPRRWRQRGSRKGPQEDRTLGRHQTDTLARHPYPEGCNHSVKNQIGFFWIARMDTMNRFRDAIFAQMRCIIATSRNILCARHS